MGMQFWQLQQCPDHIVGCTLVKQIQKFNGFYFDCFAEGGCAGDMDECGNCQPSAVEDEENEEEKFRQDGSGGEEKDEWKKVYDM